MLSHSFFTFRHIAACQDISFAIADIDRDRRVALNDRGDEIDIRVIGREDELACCLRPNGHVLLFLLLERACQIIGKKYGNSHDNHGYYQY